MTQRIDRIRSDVL